MIPKNVVKDVTGRVEFPDMNKLAHFTKDELKELKITEVSWNDVMTYTFGLKLNDDQNCKAGNLEFEHTHGFDITKKITKVEVIFDKEE